MTNPRFEKLKKFLSENPTDPFLRYAMALENKAMGKANQSISDLASLVLDHPDHTAAFYQLGLLYAETGMTKKALEVLTTGLASARVQGDTKTLHEIEAAISLLNEGLDG